MAEERAPGNCGGGLTGRSPKLLRALNRRRVIDLFQAGTPLSRAEVARRSRLSKPTVSLVMDDLVSADLVRSAGRTVGRKGPSATLYELNPSVGYAVGIDISRRYVRAAVADITGALVARRQQPAGRGRDRLTAQIGALAQDVAREAGVAWGDVAQTCVAVPGVVAGHEALSLTNLPAWTRKGLLPAIRDVLGPNVVFENDVNLATLGEQSTGRGRGVKNFALLWIGTGVGLGVVLDGELYRGIHGRAGEIGYLPISAGRRPATRGSEPFSAVAGEQAVVALAHELGMQGELTSSEIFAAARAGDRTALRVVEIEAERVAMGITAVAAVLDPEFVLLGGEVGFRADVLVGPVERVLKQISPLRPRVELSPLGEDAVLCGAVASAVDAAREIVFSRSSGAAEEAIA